MEIAKTRQPRQSTTFDDDDDDNSNNNEESSDRNALLSNEKDLEGSYIPPDPVTGERNVKRLDWSKWLLPLSVAFSILVLATIALASLNTLLRAPSSSSSSSPSPSPSILLDISNAVLGVSSSEGDGDGDGDATATATPIATATATPIASSQPKMAIELDPTAHVFRSPETITHHWNITSDFLSPDGVKKKIYLVNGQFPGPTIECRSGDKLVIHVTNSIDEEGVSIHWHGLHLGGANSMDGAVGFTQCPIPPGGQFTYEFDIDEEQSGTFWWHAHSQVQRGDGMYGGLVVHKPAADTHTEMETYGYDNELLLLIGDWYHRSSEEVLAWYTSVRAFGNEVRPPFRIDVPAKHRVACS